MRTTLLTLEVVALPPSASVEVSVLLAILTQKGGR